MDGGAPRVRTAAPGACPAPGLSRRSPCRRRSRPRRSARRRLPVVCGGAARPGRLRSGRGAGPAASGAGVDRQLGAALLRGRRIVGIRRSPTASCSRFWCPPAAGRQELESDRRRSRRLIPGVAGGPGASRPHRRPRFLPRLPPELPKARPRESCAPRAPPSPRRQRRRRRLPARLCGGAVSSGAAAEGGEQVLEVRLPAGSAATRRSR